MRKLNKVEPLPKKLIIDNRSQASYFILFPLIKQVLADNQYHWNKYGLCEATTFTSWGITILIFHNEKSIRIGIKDVI